MKDVRQLIADSATEQERYYWGFVEYRGVEFPCETCHGLGTRTYSDTSTWLHGVGGQMLTKGVCDSCWGTGDKYRHGLNLREVLRKIREL